MLATALVLAGSLSSCYTYEASIGEGARGTTQVKKKNHYLVYGLAPISTADAQQMAGGSNNYDLKITHTFVDGLINALTFGIYNPTTVIVTK